MTSADTSNGATPVSHKPVTETEVARGAATALLARFGAVIELVSQPAYTWLFSVATYGVYTVLWSTVNIVSNICDLAMTTVLQRTVPQAKTEEEAHASLKVALLLILGITVPLAALGSIAAPWLAKVVNAAPKDQPTLALAIGLFVWTLPLWTFLEVAGSAMRARRAFGPEIRLKVFYEQASRLTFAFLCFFIGLGSLGLVVAHLSSLIFISFISVRLLGRYYNLKLLLTVRIPKGMPRDMVSYGLAILPANVLKRCYSDLPPILLNTLLPGAKGATAAALYGIARKVASVMQMVKLSFGYVMAPLASAQKAAVDHNAVQPLYGFATRLATAGILPLLAAIIGLSQEILLLFAPEARAALALVIILSIGRTLEALLGPSGAILEVIGQRRLTLINSAAGLVSWIALSLALTPALGAVGMAVAVAISLNVAAGLALLQLYWSYRLHPFRAPFLRTLVVSLAVSCLALAVEEAVSQWSEAAGAVVAVAAFAVAFWLSLRFGLALADRSALGRFGQWMRLKV
ncbi:lipopolysaccharide biosynthesis protein [Pedomonas mirosovicensis]|uniref:lipopolysaccharide biosynthesis protein n=1 Tax=Pedomonas mirosovicensis TaxID=2908641 RepID=UPI002169AC5F|nr:polysaccharide biosynthesis C-terminal domain-containing protein [Pedomonas mirosovicensis]MCH8685220.1 polysaccharide biosynthesis C-terminal domain-containing protein [Pedomonas mirosovicensis]